MVGEKRTFDEFIASGDAGAAIRQTQRKPQRHNNAIRVMQVNENLTRAVRFFHPATRSRPSGR